MDFGVHDLCPILSLEGKEALRDGCQRLMIYIIQTMEQLTLFKDEMIILESDC